MTDDIVTRLAESACPGCYECVCGMCALLSDAVDEIKRLREQVAEYKNLYLLRSRLGDAVGGV